ncbi:hypothetical protein DAPPUDRAFT_248698 [Daphnia pulex]|uniref:Uncharacterized protein n=1 Tax=Daphnia pulex TaxID=6669 RepID=E9GV15_DAPPU|nr:hypothetical protein DAPPUDRAFT_248698 [Daphnia pulex]|eukprot:EFX76693.1 hypothetical protein DAPPUDRAFT_248698 [Daphnia pulex]
MDDCPPLQKKLHTDEIQVRHHHMAPTRKQESSNVPAQTPLRAQPTQCVQQHNRPGSRPKLPLWMRSHRKHPPHTRILPIK